MTETPSLTYALRELVWKLESEVAVITGLSRRIDERVEALNAARQELAERLEQLDELVAEAVDPRLVAVLRELTDAPLPVEDEHFPERMYGG